MVKTLLLKLDGITYRESLSIQEYLQRKLVFKEASCMYLLFVNYKQHIFTHGKNGKKNNLLIKDDECKKLDIKVFESDRGGDITYHGPGQLVCYPIFNLKELNLGVKQFVARIEEVIKAFLIELGMVPQSLEKKPGVWVFDKKIASVGLNIKRHITKHGFSLNIDNELSYYRYINPCGYSGLEMTSVKNELATKIDHDYCCERIKHYIESSFNINIVESSTNEVLDNLLKKVL